MEVTDIKPFFQELISNNSSLKKGGVKISHPLFLPKIKSSKPVRSQASFLLSQKKQNRKTDITNYFSNFDILPKPLQAGQDMKFP